MDNRLTSHGDWYHGHTGASVGSRSDLSSSGVILGLCRVNNWCNVSSTGTGKQRGEMNLDRVKYPKVGI